MSFCLMQASGESASIRHAKQRRRRAAAIACVAMPHAAAAPAGLVSDLEHFRQADRGFELVAEASNSIQVVADLAQ